MPRHDAYVVVLLIRLRCCQSAFCFAMIRATRYIAARRQDAFAAVAADAFRCHSCHYMPLPCRFFAITDAAIYDTPLFRFR